jgi:outer membrane protein
MIRAAALCCLLALAAPGAVSAQTAVPSRGEVLTLERAIEIAVESNRHVQSARLQIEKAQADLASARTSRLPSFSTEVSTSQLLTPVGFAFPQGAFGEFPGIGPVPATNTTVTVPRRPTVYVQAEVAQPLTQLVRIGLKIRNAAAARDIEIERTRGQELSIVNSVKRLYFGILQTESAVAATEASIELYRELDRTLQVRVAQQVALRGDALDVQFQLAQEELTRTTARNTLASQKEQLNSLLGRDVRTTFEVADVAELSLSDVDLDAARTRALDERPDVREARLKVTQAELDRRATTAERIPDVSLAASYTSNFNIDVLPANLATLGVRVTWEPFDWGRRRNELAGKTRTLEQARLNLREVEDRSVLEINSRFRALDEKRALLRVARMAQASAREKLRVKTNQFQLRAALLPDVLQVRAELADADDRHQQALLGFWTAKADYDLALGQEGR